MDRLPPEMVKIIAAHAGFFDRAKLSVCNKQLSQACATVKSDVLVVVRMGGAETYAGEERLCGRRGDSRCAAIVAGRDAGLPFDAEIQRRPVEGRSRKRVYYTRPTCTRYLQNEPRRLRAGVRRQGLG